MTSLRSILLYPTLVKELGKSCNKGENNGQWRGDSVKYRAVHSYVRKYKPKPKSKLCEICNKNALYDIANVTGIYKRF